VSWLNWAPKEVRAKTKEKDKGKWKDFSIIEMRFLNGVLKPNFDS